MKIFWICLWLNLLIIIFLNISSRKEKKYYVFYEGIRKGGYSYHCACIKTIKKGSILCFGYNDEHGHAEVNAIKILKKKYSKPYLNNIINKEGSLIMEIVRFHNTENKFNLSYPCKNCQKIINRCQFIKKVYYS